MTLPKTVILHHHLGIGDLIWHIPYIRAVAAKSQSGKVSLIARPSTFAKEILTAETCVEEVLYYDRRPRPSEKRRGQHQGIGGFFRFAKELQSRQFDRILILSNRQVYIWLALLAGIKQRAGYGFDAPKRLFLNQPPYIERYRGDGNRVYPEVTEFMIRHGFVEAPIVPKMRVPEDCITRAADDLKALHSPRFAMAVGASEPHKNLGVERFAALATAIAQRGNSVVFLGGPRETEFVDEILKRIPHVLHPHLRGVCQKDILYTAGVLRNCQYCVGNDTGVLNMAVANDVPSIGFFGGRSRLRHDPLIVGMSAESMDEFTVDSIVKEMVVNGWL